MILCFISGPPEGVENVENKPIDFTWRISLNYSCDLYIQNIYHLISFTVNKYSAYKYIILIRLL